MSTLQHIVVMGVSGSGKTTLGEALAAHLKWPFIEGDAFHPKSNVQKMASGQPLNDEDRKPWLLALADQLRQDEARGENTVIGCSSLKRSYRDILRSGAPKVRFLHVHGDRAILEDRLKHREGHFFPAKLLDSQLATLQPLEEDEDGVVTDLALGVADQVADAVRKLQL